MKALPSTAGNKTVPRAAIYARHSMDKQITSTKDQITRCQDYCKKSGYEVALVFRDEAVSGASVVNRNGVRGLIDAAIEDYFDLVIAEDLSRISRNQGDVAHFYERMKFLDIKLETVLEGVITELHIGLKGTMNALYLKDLSDKTHRGVIASVLRGCIPGGRTFGYEQIHQMDEAGQPIPGLRKINEKEAEIIRLIYDQYEHGMTLKKICEALNAQAFLSPKGGKWVPTTLIGQLARKTGLLRQTLYKGVVSFNRLGYRKNPDTGKRLSFIRPQSEWISVPAPELAILSKTQFDAVQNLIENRSTLRKQRVLLNKVLSPEERTEREAQLERARWPRRVGPRQRRLYIVTSRLWCDEHHALMTTTKKKEYSCPVKGCKNRNRRLDRDLMPLVLAELSRFNTGDLDDYLDGCAQERAIYQKKIARLEKKLARLRKEVNNVLDVIARERKNDTTTAWLKNRELRIRRVQHDLSLLYNKMRSVKNLTAPEKKAVVSSFLLALRPLTRAHQEDDFNQTATLIVHPWIKRFSLSTKWDVNSRSWQHSLTATYNGRELLMALTA